MLRYIKYRFDLRRLKKLQRRQERELLAAYETAAKRGHDDGELSMAGQQSGEMRDWILYRQTEYLESVCQALVIPLPAKDDSQFYFKTNFDDNEGERSILTTAGINVVRGRIREERKAQRESVGFWFAMTTGGLGSLIGLVSVLKK
jgi:hypothetical protein